jgi:hypothetical protein
MDEVGVSSWVALPRFKRYIQQVIRLDQRGTIWHYRIPRNQVGDALKLGAVPTDNAWGLLKEKPAAHLGGARQTNTAGQTRSLQGEMYDATGELVKQDYTPDDASGSGDGGVFA